MKWKLMTFLKFLLWSSIDNFTIIVSILLLNIEFSHIMTNFADFYTPTIMTLGPWPPTIMQPHYCECFTKSRTHEIITPPYNKQRKYHTFQYTKGTPDISTIICW